MANWNKGEVTLGQKIARWVIHIMASLYTLKGRSILAFEVVLCAVLISVLIMLIF